jgi:NTE family protein
MENNLRKIPFFSELPDQVLEAISQRLQREHYHKDTTIFLQGEPADRMYLIESGQVKVLSDEGGREKVIAYLGTGNFFGEMGVLLGEKRSATVRVVIDVSLLVLHKDDLDLLLEQHPAIALTISRELGRRLGRTIKAPVEREEFSVVAAVGNATPTLARYLGQVTGEDVFIFDLGGLANVTPDRASLRRDYVTMSEREEPVDAEALPGRVAELVEKYYWVILAIQPYETPLPLKAMDLADITVNIAQTENNWLKSVAPHGYSHSDPREKSIRRLARKIAQRQVGIALSSGNARGMAHIGVLKVLEEEGIPIDFIAATSAGAVFGSLYASGRSIAELIDFAVDIQRKYNFLSGFRFWDFRLPPRTGLIKGDMVLNYFRQSLMGKTFADLEIPMNIIATDVITGEEIVFDHGYVADAVRASMSVIGVLEPAYNSGRFLVDGGAVNPVPSQLLADKGMDIIIASNVIPSLEDRLHRREQKRDGRAPNVIGILMGAMEIMESQIINTRMGPVDVLIQPQVGMYGTFEFDKVWDFIKRGEEAARQQVPTLRRLLAPRPRKPEGA